MKTTKFAKIVKTGDVWKKNFSRPFYALFETTFARWCATLRGRFCNMPYYQRKNGTFGPQNGRGSRLSKNMRSRSCLGDIFFDWVGRQVPRWGAVFATCAITSIRMKLSNRKTAQS